MQRTIFEPSHELFRESFRTFVHKEMKPHFEQWEQAGLTDRSLFLRAGEAGFLGTDVPEQYGGGGVKDFRYNQIISEEIQAGAVVGSGLAITLHNDICLPYYLNLATDEQKGRWLPGIVSGELITAIAMTEPGIGSDLAGMATTAIRHGDHYVVNGSKTFITNGINSDVVIVAAKTDPIQEAQWHVAADRRAGHGRLRAGPQPREAGPALPGHRRAVLQRRGGAGRRTCSAPRARASSTWSRTCPRSGCRSRAPGSARPGPRWAGRSSTARSAPRSGSRSAASRTPSSAWPRWPPRSRSAPSTSTSA